MNCGVGEILENPLDCKEIQPAYSEGNKSWIFTGRTDVEAETPILWPPDVKTDSLEKILTLGKIEGRRRMGWQRMRWHHQLHGYESEQALGVGDGQGSLACCSPWGSKEWDTTKRLNWTHHSAAMPRLERMILQRLEWGLPWSIRIKDSFFNLTSYPMQKSFCTRNPWLGTSGGREPTSSASCSI